MTAPPLANELQFGQVIHDGDCQHSWKCLLVGNAYNSENDVEQTWVLWARGDRNNPIVDPIVFEWFYDDGIYAGLHMGEWLEPCPEES